MKKALVFLLVLMFQASLAAAMSFYGDLEDPASPGRIDMDKPDGSGATLFLDRYGEECDVNILGVHADKGLVSMELELDPAPDYLKDISVVWFHMDRKDSANYLDFTREDQ